MVARKHVERRVRAAKHARSREDSIDRKSLPEIRVRSDLCPPSPRPIPTPSSLDDPEEFALSFFFTVYASPATNVTNPLDTREH